MFVFIAVLLVNGCLAGTIPAAIPATPENITVTFLTPTAVRVSWQTQIDLKAHPIEKYIVTYKPTDDSYRVVQDVAGSSEAIVLDRLLPSTQYSLSVTAIWMGKKYRSRGQIKFRTLDLPKNTSQQDFPPGIYGRNGSGNGSIFGDDVTSTATNTLTHSTTRELPTIRGVEIGIVLIVLMVWAGAIALFFNRWGKIRMLLPYQPDYKHEQLKVPGTGVCSASGCNGQHSHQNLHPDFFVKHIHMLAEERSTSISERCTRSRINSAIFVSSEGRGFDSIEFLRRHGSQSVLCRKAKSAENITDNGRRKSLRPWRTDDDSVQQQQHQQQDSSQDIELRECGNTAGELLTLPVLHDAKQSPTATTSLLARSSAITTANVIVGSISLEAPPPYMQDDDTHSISALIHSDAAAIVHDSQDSAETVEELVHVPLLASQTATASVSAASSPSIAIEAKPRVLVHQRSSTASSSPHNSPKSLGLGLKIVKPKINAVPMVSVSGPSPPIEKPPLAECL
ncbi:uncharacterized protein LOC132790172 isoform X4 [Drosophila nasuta]|uniref:uncharacterized protein LOC132790172 isoform X4 n=1 Tax=Drosophila nasuta TaxID=42062 RepID=UPI00295EEE38|nr:uncharacterized protein LOC132790172 isoform X4 [Drosophila nasuta]